MAPVLKTGRAKALVGSNPTPSAIQLSDFGLRIADWRENPARDEIRGHEPDDSSADDVRQIMRRDVHARKSDQERDEQERRADSPAGQGQGRKKGGGSSRVPRGKGVVARAEAWAIPGSFRLHRRPRATRRDFYHPRDGAREGAGQNHRRYDPHPLLVPPPIGEHQKDKPEQDVLPANRQTGLRRA